MKNVSLNIYRSLTRRWKETLPDVGAPNKLNYPIMAPNADLMSSDHYRLLPLSGGRTIDDVSMVVILSLKSTTHRLKTDGFSRLR